MHPGQINPKPNGDAKSRGLGRPHESGLLSKADGGGDSDHMWRRSPEQPLREDGQAGTIPGRILRLGKAHDIENGRGSVDEKIQKNAAGTNDAGLEKKQQGDGQRPEGVTWRWGELVEAEWRKEQLFLAGAEPGDYSGDELARPGVLEPSEHKQVLDDGLGIEPGPPGEQEPEARCWEARGAVGLGFRNSPSASGRRKPRLWPCRPKNCHQICGSISKLCHGVWRGRNL